MKRWMKNLGKSCLALLVLVCLTSLCPADHATKVARVGEDIRLLAADDMEGRGPGTDGLDKAAEYIRERFVSLGLQGAGKNGEYLRPFTMTVGQELVEQQTHLILRGPDGQEHKLKLGADYQPMAAGGTEPIKADVVFAGYGISAPKFKYDDYQDAEVKDKVVLIIRREPQQDDEQSVFNGKRTTSHSYLRTKTQAAKKAGAAAILMVNDPFTTSKEKKDELNRPGSLGRGSSGIAFAQVKQDVVNELLQQAPIVAGDQQFKNLKSIAAAIDEELSPVTQPLPGWTAELAFTFKTVKDEVSNVAAVIEGEGPLADETIVIGAHYDHLGFGPRGSRRPDSREVHNGADDNATGTAGILELARRYAQRAEKPARRLVFIAFTAEERGIIGSNHYLKDPLFPLDKTIAMVNFDMIGHLDNNGLVLGGVKSAREFPELIESLCDGGELEVRMPSTTGGSDHAGFYRKEIPFLFFHTGLTDVYHTPDDDFETIYLDGVAQTIDFAERVVDAIINLPERPEFTKIQRTGRKQRAAQATAYLGIVPDYATNGAEGVRCTEVNPGSPAAKGDLRAGDVITKIAEVDIASIQDLMVALRKYKAGTRVKVVVRRGDQDQELDVTLGAPGDRP